MNAEFCFIEVALPIAIDNVFTYKLLNPKSNDLIGCRIIVPFKNKKLTGVILNIPDNINTLNYDIKLAYELLDEKPIISDKLVSLAKWISDYYFSPIGETIKAMIPLSLNIKTDKKIKLKQYLSDSEINIILKNSPNQRVVYDFLINRKNNTEISVSFLKKKLKIDNISNVIEGLANKNLVEIKDELNQNISPKYEKIIHLNEDFFADNDKVIELMNSIEKKAPKKFQFFIMLIEKFEEDKSSLSYSDVVSQYNKKIIDFFATKDVIKIELQEKEQSSINNTHFSLARTNELNLPLTLEQINVKNSIEEAIVSSVFKTFLFFGVTGSGKTLIYLHAIRKALEIGKSALVLVPEISLTPQLIDRFSLSFPNQVAIFHSKMSEQERLQVFNNTLKGNVKIVIGARSAVFAPLNNLGLIIVDEEHESSYKQDSPNPRYNGRDVAIMRGKLENAIVVLGSATPSIESYYNAKVGKYHLLEIKSRADGANLPTIKIIDTINNRKKGLMKGEFTNELLEKIIEKIQKKEGVILFQNRRGFASYLQCPDCGFIPMCNQCSVSLVYHKTTQDLQCHYCNSSRKKIITCPECGSNNIKEIGAGTQRIEDELAALLEMEYQTYTIERIDLDTTRLKGSHRGILERFAKGKTDILVGTQMVAKGIDFERVTLVGVMNADLLMYVPNFRASERALQLLIQVSGRAGRKSNTNGEVIIQTSQPDSFVIQNVVNNDYVSFFNNEIITRQNAKYPPFYRFCVVEFKDENVEKVEAAAAFFRNFLKNNNYNDVLGPIVPTINKIQKQFRRIIIIKNNKIDDPQAKFLRLYLKNAKSHYLSSKYKNIKFVIDIDSNQSV